MMVGPGQLLDLLRARGHTSGRDLQETLRISQPTLSRLTRAAGEGVLQIGRARATRYALAREVRTFGTTWPVHRIDVEGAPHVVGTLRAIHPEGWWLDSLDPALRRLQVGVASELPRIIGDLRPAGFLGRTFGRRHAGVLGLGSDVDGWNDDDLLAVLLLHGHDLPGDLIVGSWALERWQQSTHDAVDEVRRPSVYEARALEVLAGDVQEPSLEGAQPKFTACVRSTDDTPRHVLVKFASDTRTADLLRCEHLASVVLRAHRVDACETEWLEGGERSFLEVRRFDRVGARGRRGVVSLRALLGAETHGGWSAAAEHLHRADLLSPADADALRLRWWFGRLIGNADMHHGDVGLLLDADRPLRLAPVYDMAPTAFAADDRSVFDPPMPTQDERSVWQAAAVIAQDFWSYAAEDPRLSDDARDHAAAALAAVPDRVRRV